MPQTRAARTMRPTSICRRVKPPKIARFARRAGCEAGFGRSSSVCSTMIGFPFWQCRGHDFLAPQDDQPGRNDEMRGDKEVLRSEEHTSELQSLMRNSYAVFCLKKKNRHTHR